MRHDAADEGPALVAQCYVVLVYSTLLGDHRLLLATSGTANRRGVDDDAQRVDDDVLGRRLTGAACR